MYNDVRAINDMVQRESAFIDPDPRGGAGR